MLKLIIESKNETFIFNLDNFENILKRLSHIKSIKSLRIL